ncbi:hypothetical protein EYF80_040723 [Liparis tanakae]|uniref:Uncharacterized protein n=1 Tax=Liparis tanakae TaxID=230148 RepID=A0A4Z2G672_9TELE|nr:hypothetical protein EYF80_040723 [Liparis tanakae]
MSSVSRHAGPYGDWETTSISSHFWLQKANNDDKPETKMAADKMLKIEASKRQSTKTTGDVIGFLYADLKIKLRLLES